MSHTQGKLQAECARDNTGIIEWFVRRDGENFAIAADIIDPESAKPSEANARRIVACWNACEGIETYALELMTGDCSIENQLKPAFKPVKVETSLAVERRHEIKALRAVNADLLATLNEVFSIGDRLVSDVYGGEFVHSARAAIAKAAALNT